MGFLTFSLRIDHFNWKDLFLLTTSIFSTRVHQIPGLAPAVFTASSLLCKNYLNGHRLHCSETPLWLTSLANIPTLNGHRLHFSESSLWLTFLANIPTLNGHRLHCSVTSPWLTFLANVPTLNGHRLLCSVTSLWLTFLANVPTFTGHRLHCSESPLWLTSLANLPTHWSSSVLLWDLSQTDLKFLPGSSYLPVDRRPVNLETSSFENPINPVRTVYIKH